MAKPVILQITPSYAYEEPGSSTILTLWIVGSNFAPTAEVEVLGSGSSYRSVRWSDSLIEYHLVIYMVASSVGIFVKNIPETLSHSTVSDPYYFPVRNSRTRDEQSLFWFGVD